MQFNNIFQWIFSVLLLLSSACAWATDLQALTFAGIATVSVSHPPQAQVCGKAYQVRIMDSLAGSVPTTLYSGESLQLNQEYLVLHQDQQPCGRNYFFKVLKDKLIIPSSVKLPGYVEKHPHGDDFWVAKDVFLKALQELNEGC